MTATSLSIAERFERLRQSRQLYLSALRHLLGEAIGDGDEPGGAR